MNMVVAVYPENFYYIAQHIQYGEYVTFVATDPEEAGEKALNHAMKMRALERN